MGVASAEPLWRAIAVYRFASIGYAVLLAGVVVGHLARLAAGRGTWICARWSCPSRRIR